MTEVLRREPGLSGLSLVLSAWRDPVARILNVDLLAVLIAILLPWSTTGVVVAAGLWVIALVPTLEAGAFLRSLKRPICILPIALFALALIGTLWSNVPWVERLYAVGPAARLLALPLLLYHFERTARGDWVFIAFLASCTLLMAVSWLVAFDPDLSLKLYLSRGPYERANGIVVKNHIDQSQEFVLCAVALAHPVMTLLRTNRIWPAALLTAVALGFAANMMFVSVSRTALVTAPIMVAAVALLHLKWRSIVIIVCAAAVLGGLAWATSPRLRGTAERFVSDYQLYSERNLPTSLGVRLVFWQKSLRFISEAPAFGHGTGSIRALFEEAAVDQFGAAAEVVANPHNQTLNVAIQWGVIGIVLLYAMWLSHLLLFRGDGLAAWTGLLVVVQNVLTSLFNSHLFDFHEGWMYVLGVGVAGGMALRARRLPHAEAAPDQAGARQEQQPKHDVAKISVA